MSSVVSRQPSHVGVGHRAAEAGAKQLKANDGWGFELLQSVVLHVPLYVFRILMTAEDSEDKGFGATLREDVDEPLQNDDAVMYSPMSACWYAPRCINDDPTSFKLSQLSSSPSSKGLPLLTCAAREDQRGVSREDGGARQEERKTAGMLRAGQEKSGKTGEWRAAREEAKRVRVRQEDQEGHARSENQESQEDRRWGETTGEGETSKTSGEE
ncbi:hypothetical protein V8E53_011675 [Lactarius tabidus]